VEPLSPKLSNREGQPSITTIAIQPSIPTLRRGRDTEKAPVKSASTYIRNPRKEPRAPIELRGNLFLSITRKKFGIYYIYKYI
jgi:hypothetical protein